MLPLLLLPLACTPVPTEVTVWRRPDVRLPVHVHWSLGPPSGRWGAETLGRVAVAAEATLYQAVIPVGPLGTPPAVADVPVRERWTLELSARGTTGEAILCMADGPCETLVAEGSPEQVGTRLGVAVLDLMGFPQPALPCLAEPPSRDPYANLLVGRSAATAYGVLPPSDRPGDRAADPIAKAIFLDPKAGVGQWIAGRVDAARGDPAAAEEHLGFATLRCPPHAGWSADAALATAVARRRMRPFPDEDRFLVARADAGLLSRDRDTLAVLDRAIDLWPTEARLTRRAADAAGPDQLDRRLAAWAAVDRADPEPVRRQSRRAVESQDWPTLLAHAQELQRRGEPAADLLTPALLALGRVDAASQAASERLAPRVRARAGGPVTGDSAEELLLGASRTLESDPGGALALARQALVARPDWPEALALAASAARRAGGDDSPFLRRLAEVEP